MAKYEARARKGNDKYTPWEPMAPTDDEKQLLNRAGVESITITYSTKMSLQFRKVKE